MRSGLIWLIWMVGLCAAGSAQAADTPPENQPNALSEPHRPAGAAVNPGCPARPEPIIGRTSALVVELAGDTLWRPRGSEVRFTIRSSSQTLVVKQVRVCFGWSLTGAGAVSGQFHQLQGSPLVRALADPSGAPAYGVVMPALPIVPQQWWQRLMGPNPLEYTGFYSVPVADMVAAITTADDSETVVVLPVGVTSVPYAAMLVLLCLLGFCIATWILSRKGPQPAGNFLLELIATRDGYASLSQFQIMLWTVVVGLCAVYVMTLSGNLIPITSGTLVLLSIAAGAALLARLPAATTPVATDPNRMPRWSDLVIVDDSSREIDVTRVQMLIFTLISAAFVTLKVIVDYEIPEIPDNFQLLMGISNGVYVSGRHLPNQGKSRPAGDLPPGQVRPMDGVAKPQTVATKEIDHPAVEPTEPARPADRPASPDTTEVRPENQAPTAPP